MPELRKDPVTRHWVIVGRDRSLGPVAYPIEAEQRQSAEDCRFCHGGEPETPREIYAIRPPGTTADAPGWSLRVVPNRFPALKDDALLHRSGQGLYDRMSGVGAHEVIVETPEHDRTLATLPYEAVEQVLLAYRHRIEALHRDTRYKYVLIFKNSGRAAGASIDHAHSQLIATPVVPKRVLEELAGAAAYHAYKERCVYCDVVRQEVASGERVCLESEHFLAFAPFASRFPYEVTLIPRQHEADFARTPPAHMADLARVLRDTCAALGRALGDPPYNYILHTVPPQAASDEVFHWHLEVMPRLTRVAGFEWGSGFYLNPTPPEEAAAHLRSVSATL